MQLCSNFKPDKEFIFKIWEKITGEFENAGVDEGYNFKYYLMKHISYVDAPKFMKILNECVCCKRHQVNRPKDLDRLFVKQDSSNTDNYIYSPKCQCICRHASRWIARCYS